MELEQTQNLLDKTKEFTNSKFSSLRKKIAETELNLKQNKIAINSDDSLMDKGFFAFLADLLNYEKRKDFKTLLTEELKENETLSKKKLLSLLNKELENNEYLSKEQKESIAKNLSNKYIQDLSFELVNKKLMSNDNNPIKANDIYELSNNSNIKEAVQSNVKEIAKTAIKKLVHKM